MNLFSRPTRPPGAVTAFTYIERTCLWLAIARVSHLLAPAGGTCILAPHVSHMLAPAYSHLPDILATRSAGSLPAQNIWSWHSWHLSLSLFLALVLSLCCVKIAHIAFRACSHHKASGSNRTASLPAGSHQRTRTSPILDL